MLRVCLRRACRYPLFRLGTLHPSPKPRTILHSPGVGQQKSLNCRTRGRRGAFLCDSRRQTLPAEHHGLHTTKKRYTLPVGAGRRNCPRFHSKGSRDMRPARRDIRLAAHHQSRIPFRIAILGEEGRCRIRLRCSRRSGVATFPGSHELFCNRLGDGQKLQRHRTPSTDSGASTRQSTAAWGRLLQRRKQLRALIMNAKERTWFIHHAVGYSPPPHCPHSFRLAISLS